MFRRSSLRLLASVSALVAIAVLAVGCSDDDSADDDTSAADDTTTTADGTDEATTTTEGDGASNGEVETTDLLDHLLEEDEAIGALFDWNTGDGVIGIEYLGVQDVGLYAVEIDEETATEACELASTYVFDIDPEASITVYTGGYSDSVAVVARTGETGSCAAA